MNFTCKLKNNVHLWKNYISVNFKFWIIHVNPFPQRWYMNTLHCYYSLPAINLILQGKTSQKFNSIQFIMLTYMNEETFDLIFQGDTSQWRNFCFDISGRYITIKKNHSLTDESLERVGKHHPVSLALIQCHGDYITAKGLRNLFRACANSLKVRRRADCGMW